MTNGLIIKNGILIDPYHNIMAQRDVFIKNDAAQTVIDASGMWVTPGLIDMHVHFRDPGYTHKEDMATGQEAAAAGGFTSVLVMPNTNPVIDCPETVSYIKKRSGLINIYICGSVTNGQKGLTLSDIKGMARSGISAISEDGFSVSDPALLKNVMTECAKHNIPMLSHCEGETEAIAVARDIELAKDTGVRLHICHVSTADSVYIIRNAKKSGLNITAEAAPHHFILSKEACDMTDTNNKMNPPLGSKDDIAAVQEGLKDGTIDCIATDHAPHSLLEKNAPYEDAPNGVIGLETALPLCITYLVKTGILSPIELIKKLTVNPAGILSINKRFDYTIIDPNEEYIIDKFKFKSRARNTPFNGFKVMGKVKYTIVGGRVIYGGAINDRLTD